MQPATATEPASIIRRDLALPILDATGRTEIAIRAGTVIGIDGRSHGFDAATPVACPALDPGRDYGVRIGEDGSAVAERLDRPDPLAEGYIAGFHFAPGGNAEGRRGGDAVPAINPCSLWDIGFRPACPDPRGMAIVDMPDAPRFWIDIYLLGVDHLPYGTSRFGATIADGASLDLLDYPTAVAIYVAHGKRLPTYDEFRLAARGVTERSAAARDPVDTGLDAARTSCCGVMQATGNLWVWGSDGDPDDARPSIFGGSWVDGSGAGSRCAVLGFWPEYSGGDLSARGACDHLAPV